MSKATVSFEPGARAEGDHIALCAPEIRGCEWEYVKDCLDTGWVSSVGKYVNRFEQMMASTSDTPFAISTVNGTCALHIALLVAGVQLDDEVLVPTLTFIAPVNAIRYVHAWPVFIDSEPVYWQIDVGKVRRFLEDECEMSDGELRNRTTGRRVRAILPVHILGHPVDMDSLMVLARRYGLVVIEDATESLGACYKSRKVGCLGDIACFSFNGNKLITTGGGGMIVTSNVDFARRARYLTTQAKDDSVEYVHNEVGYNYRLTNVLAAIGCAQMEKLDEYISIKRRNAALYTEALQDTPGVSVMREAPWAFSTYWLFTVLVDENEYGISSRDLLVSLADAGIQARPLWQPIHLSPAHRGPWVPSCGFDTAERLARTALSLPSSVGLRRDEMDRVVQSIRRRK